MIKVSVLIPVYNTSKYLEKCISSVPEREDVEIVIIDDYSTDDSVKILEKIASTRKNITIIQNKQNMGIGYNRNRLIEAARGEYIFFLDSDDWIFGETFNFIVDAILNGQPCVKGLHINPFNQVFPVEVHRGDFVLKSFIGETRHDEKLRCFEDTGFKEALRNKYGYKQEQIPLILYYYFEPRIDSLTWQSKKARGYASYQKDEEHWIKSEKPWWNHNKNSFYN